MVSIPISSGHCNFVDYEGLNDQITTTSTNQSCCTNFRREVQDRDGESCIITQEAAVHCDAAHLISHSKGDEVLFMIILACDPLMMVCSSTSMVLSTIVLPFITLCHPQFLGFIMFRMEYCWQKACIHILSKERLPS